MESESAKSEASVSSQESASPQRPVRGRGRPRRARGRGMRGRGRGRGRHTPETAPSQSTTFENRRRHIEMLISVLTVDQAKRHLIKLSEKVPSLVFDLMEGSTETADAEPPSPRPSNVPPFCSCTRCREMPTEPEQICCGRNETNCVSLLPHFELLCLDETVLAVARLQRQDLLALDQEPDMNKQLRHTAYRQYIYWQHGRLGEGRRRVIPSCCVWAIRMKFPDMNNFYVGFKTGRFGV